MEMTFYVKEEVVRDRNIFYIDRGDMRVSVRGDCPSSCKKLVRARFSLMLSKTLPRARIVSISYIDRRVGHIVFSNVPLSDRPTVIQRRGSSRRTGL